MAGQDQVRPSRDGDQFHYQWAARKCLELLPGRGDLVAVTIEGPSATEAEGDAIPAGEQLIDVGLYYGDEDRDKARLVRYIQLKHSTRQALARWTASGLEKTVTGFSRRFSELLKRHTAEDVAQRFRFEFTTNRPISSDVIEALEDLAVGATARHVKLQESLVAFTELDTVQASHFFRIFVARGGGGDLWEQRNLLARDISSYLPDADYDAPVQLKELVTRKATTEFESDPAIRLHDVLRAMKVTEDQLRPANCLLPDVTNTLLRDQEHDILEAILTAQTPVIIHADGGVGKSVLAARLAASVPPHCESVLYDCFGSGLYRSALHFRHRHRDALVQMANELAARGLCHPLIPTVHADRKEYLRAFHHRTSQAIRVLRARDPEAVLCLIVDAADNAEMAAEEQQDSGSFVRDLVQAPLPEGVRLALTCRTHRRAFLRAPQGILEIELRPFSEEESARHLRTVYPDANSTEVKEFAFLSSANPRVQALALSRGLPLHETLKGLGPEPTTVERAIYALLEDALARLRAEWGASETAQIDLICQGLAVLRPLVPVPVLAQLAGVPESAVRSFALDLGRPVLLKGNSLRFIDEPVETWFRERFRPGDRGLAQFLERLRPIAAQSSYAAALLPNLLLEAGRLDELVQLALSGERLPTENPLARRDVELQRLIFALKACLRHGRYLAATKLALRAGGESAGEQRQNRLIQANTDIAALLMTPDRVDEIVSRRTFASGWMGSHHAYDAGLLSGRDEFSAEASSRLRMALDWLHHWARLPSEAREQEEVGPEDRAELALALLKLRSPAAAASFLRSWTWRRHAFEAGRLVARRLVDLGRRDQIDALAEAADNDVWLLLGLATEVRAVGHVLPPGPLARLLRLLGDRRVQLEESHAWNASWEILHAVRSAVEIALRVLPRDPVGWATILRRYLPAAPPSELTNRFGFDRSPLLRAYALEAALRDGEATLNDVSPPTVREELGDARRQYGRSQDTEVFLREVGALLPWCVMSAEVACGRMLPDLADRIGEALKKTSSAESRSYGQGRGIRQVVVVEWLRLLQDAGAVHGPAADAFKSWVGRERDSLWPDTLIALGRVAARTEGWESLAVDFTAGASRALDDSRDDAESRAASYLALARAIIPVSPTEAAVCFDRAAEIAGRIGDENLDRWAALLHLADAAAERQTPRPRTAYRLSRVAELTYEYVARDKYFDWRRTAVAIADLCPSSALAILSRWRDRRFGDQARMIPLVIYRLIDRKMLPGTTSIALHGLRADWNRVEDVKRLVQLETDPVARAAAAKIAFRYIRVQGGRQEEWPDLSNFVEAHGLTFLDLDRLLAFREESSQEARPSSVPGFSGPERNRRVPNWDQVFDGVDLTRTDAVRAAYASVRTFDPPYEVEAFFREAFARVKVGREPELVHAISAWPGFGIFDLRHLLDALPQPLPKLVSLRSAVSDAVRSACRREPEWVARRGWGAVIPFERLVGDGLICDADVVLATLEGFQATLDGLGAGGFFKLTDPLASRLTPAEADEALNFGLDLLEDVLRPEDGDGTWHADLKPPESAVSALAGYVWAGLGSPVVAERWQCAHVVRSAVELDWTEFLQALLPWAASGAAGPFVDAGLRFYEWHARQWLLIGLARGGVSNATALRTAAPLLREWVKEEHVLIRALAADSLRALVAAGQSDGDAAVDLDTINRPGLPAEVYTGWLEPVDEGDAASEGAQSDDEKYYFGIDIGPYWFAPLGRAFGLTENAVERRCLKVLRQRMGWEGGRGWREDARQARGVFNDRETHHSHGGLPRTDDLRAYHGYHAMMIVAASLLNERPVRRRSDGARDEFSEWFSNYALTRKDGRWLSDQRDPRLVPDPAPPDGYSDEAWRWRVSSEYLARQLETDDGRAVLWGHWTSGERDDSEAVAIRSALVSRNGAKALVSALQTAPRLGQHPLPSAGMDNWATGSNTVRGWVEDEYTSAGIDEGDPWAEGLRHPGPEPCSEVTTRLELSPSGDGRTWTSKYNGLLRREVWTRITGYGREAEAVAGYRLGGDRAFIRALLDAHPDEALVISVEVRRQRSRYGSDRAELEPYLCPYVRYYLMERDGVAHAL